MSVSQCFTTGLLVDSGRVAPLLPFTINVGLGSLFSHTSCLPTKYVGSELHSWTRDYFQSVNLQINEQIL